MKTLEIHGLEAWYQLKGLCRTPAFAIPSIAFPIMFYSFFGLIFSSGSDSTAQASYMLATYGTFGVMAPALFGFGVNTAIERGQGWLRLKLVSPMPPSAWFLAKMVMSIIFAVIIISCLALLGVLVGGVRLTLGQWLMLYTVLTLGTLPFCALGLWLGSFLSSQAAPAVVNLVYLPMSVLSGLWMPIFLFPDWLQKIAEAMPAYHLAQLALTAVGRADSSATAWHLGYLLVFTLVFSALGLRAFRRQQLL